mgnify:CR=1 FL=1
MKKSRIIITLLLTVIFSSSIAQSTTLSPGVDIMSRYIWRGLNLGGSSPSIQPSIKLTHKNFTLGTWGAFDLGNNLTIQETDLYLTYSPVEMLSFTLTDYFFADELATNNHYFEYNEDSTAHILEFAASFNGTDKIPFTFLAAVNFWGADARKSDNKKQYSTYFELGYKRMLDDVECKIFIGGTVNDPKDNETGFYAESAGITNIGITAIRKIEISSKFNIPITGSFIINPKSEKIFLVMGFSF